MELEFSIGDKRPYTFVSEKCHNIANWQYNGCIVRIDDSHAHDAEGYPYWVVVESVPKGKPRRLIGQGFWVAQCELVDSSSSETAPA